MTDIIHFRVNRNKKKVNPIVSAAHSVTKKCIQITSSQRLKDLKEVTVKKNTGKKLNWAVTAYNDWRDDRMDTNQYDYSIYNSDLRKLDLLDKYCFKDSLCLFIPEVTKRNGEAYPGKTLYQLMIALQSFLNANKISWKLIDDPDFLEVCTVLDNIMIERTEMNLGIRSRQADLITHEMENDLWECNFLGDDTPDKLRTTAYFLLGINCYLRSVQDHYNLRRWAPDQDSQIKFENVNGKRCLVYREDFISKTHDGGLGDMKNDRKEVYVFPNDDPKRCAVRIIDKYVGLCPAQYKKKNFYLQSLRKPTPALWYRYQVVGEKAIGKIVADLMERAGYKGYFTGHSLCRSGTTRLSNAGVPTNIIKECTGHRSDAVDKYKVTSATQKELCSKIVSAKVPPPATVSVPPKCVETEVKVIDPDINVIEKPTVTCSCNSSNASNLVTEILKSVSDSGSAKIKIEIEISKK